MALFPQNRPNTRSDDSSVDSRWYRRLAALTGWSEYEALAWSDERAYSRTTCRCTYGEDGKVRQYCFQHFQEAHYGSDVGKD